MNNEYNTQPVIYVNIGEKKERKIVVAVERERESKITKIIFFIDT